MSKLPTQEASEEQPHRAQRETAPPPTESDDDTRILFTSWDSPLVPSR
jgi:hypothetical protein